MKGIFLTMALAMVSAASAPVSVVSVYLHPRVAEGPLCLSDIADVEGETGLTGDIEGLPIDASVWSDGFIDRGEVLSLLESVPGPSYCVYGSAVRVDRPANELKETAVAQGANVTVIVIKKGVRLRVNGVALQNGNTGDTVRVRTATSAVIEGRVMKNGTVEKAL